MDKPTKRVIFTAQAELGLKRFDNTGDEPRITLTGYAITYDTLSSDRGGYAVRLKPGSAHFTASVSALYHHDFASIIGTTSNGTLRLMPDEKGVAVEIDLPATTLGRDLATLVADKYVQGMSFSMVAGPAESEAVEENGQEILDVYSFLCDEVTVTPIPAFTSTSIALKDPTPAAMAEKSSDDMQERDDLAAKQEKYRLDMYGLVGQSFPRDGQ